MDVTWHTSVSEGKGALETSVGRADLHIPACPLLAFLNIITLVIHKFLCMGSNLDYSRSNQADLKYM